MELGYDSVIKSIPYFENKEIALEATNIFGSLMNVCNKLVNRTVKALVKNKSDKVLKDISKSGGDIKKCSFYKDSKICMDALVMMSRRGGGGKKFILDLVAIHDWLISSSKELKNICSKRTTNHVGNQFYISMVMAWAYGVSVGIVTCTTTGSTGVITWEKQDKVSKTKYGQMIHKLATCVRNGKLDDAIKRVASTKNASESGLAFAAVVAVGGALLLLYFVRYIIMRFFELRGGIADWLRNQSYFVKLISDNNKGITEEQRAKQQEDGKMLEKLAEKIDVDLKEEDDVPDSSDMFNRESEAVVSEAQKPAPSQVESFMGQDNPPESNGPSVPVSGLDF
jgi:hypothetical protein